MFLVSIWVWNFLARLSFESEPADPLAAAQQFERELGVELAANLFDIAAARPGDRGRRPHDDASGRTGLPHQDRAGDTQRSSRQHGSIAALSLPRPPVRIRVNASSMWRWPSVS